MSYKVSKKEKSSLNEDFGEVCGGEYRNITLILGIIFIIENQLVTNYKLVIMNPIY